MSALIDLHGKPLDPMARALSEMAQRQNEALFGGGPDWRVAEVRRSVLGDAEPLPRRQIDGLAAWLPKAGG